MKMPLSVGAYGEEIHQMVYFTAKSNLAFAREFKDNVMELWRIEDIAASDAHFGLMAMIPSERQKAVQRAAGPLDGYQEVREIVAQGIVKMGRLSRRSGLNLSVTSVPAPAVGGVVFNQDILLAIISDGTHGGIERQMIIDSINQIIGQLKEKEEGEWRQLINPFYWLKVVFIFVLRLPAELIKLAGFNVEKFEEHFWGKLFQLLWIMALIGFLIWIGFAKTDILEIMKGWFAKTS